MKTWSRLESGCVWKKLKLQLRTSALFGLGGKEVSVTEEVLVSAVRSAHSPGFGVGFFFFWGVCVWWIWAGDSENAGVLRFEACVQMFETVNAPQERKKKKVLSSGSYFIKSIIHHPYNVFFIPNAKGLYGKHVLRLMSQISHGENGAWGSGARTLEALGPAWVCDGMGKGKGGCRGTVHRSRKQKRIAPHSPLRPRTLQVALPIAPPPAPLRWALRAPAGKKWIPTDAANGVCSCDIIV